MVHELDLAAIVHAIAATHGCSDVEARALLLKWEQRVGGPAHRFEGLLVALEERFPEAHGRFDSSPPEPAYLEQVDRLLGVRSGLRALSEHMAQAPDPVRAQWVWLLELAAVSRCGS